MGSRNSTLASRPPSRPPIFLPDVLISHILSYCDAHDLYQLSRVNWQWHTLVERESVWRRLLDRDFGVYDAEVDSKRLYREYYRERRKKERRNRRIERIDYWQVSMTKFAVRATIFSLLYFLICIMMLCLGLFPFRLLWTVMPLILAFVFNLLPSCLSLFSRYSRSPSPLHLLTSFSLFLFFLSLSIFSLCAVSRAESYCAKLDWEPTPHPVPALAPGPGQNQNDSVTVWGDWRGLCCSAVYSGKMKMGKWLEMKRESEWTPWQVFAHTIPLLVSSLLLGFCLLSRNMGVLLSSVLSGFAFVLAAKTAVEICWKMAGQFPTPWWYVLLPLGGLPLVSVGALSVLGVEFGRLPITALFFLSSLSVSCVPFAIGRTLDCGEPPVHPLFLCLGPIAWASMSAAYLCATIN